MFHFHVQFLILCCLGVVISGNRLRCSLRAHLVLLTSGLCSREHTQFRGWERVNEDRAGVWKGMLFVGEEKSVSGA